MNVDAYLRRIGYTGACQPTSMVLRAIHLAHLYSVPFENLDIPIGRTIELDLPRLYAKIITARRGGFCYELNGLFAWLLEQLGFYVSYLAAEVAHSDGGFGPEFDHLTLQVLCPADTIPGTRWLADVGFGESFREPLRLDQGGEQPQDDGVYGLDGQAPYRILQRLDEGNTLRPQWRPQYRFTLRPRKYAEFGEACVYHQTSPRSSFTQRRVCSLARPGGRISLEHHRLIVTEQGKREEQTIRSADEYEEILYREFGFVRGGFTPDELAQLAPAQALS